MIRPERRRLEKIAFDDSGSACDMGSLSYGKNDEGRSY